MTREEIKEMLNALYKCKKSIIEGEAQSYQVGTRSVNFISLKDVNREIRMYENMLDVADGRVTARGVKTVIPLDT